MGLRKYTQTLYLDGRTKQSFRDETDINKILARAQKTGTISHLAKHEGTYGDFADYDFFTNMQMLTRGREIFDDLPSEIRTEFSNSPADFFKYVNDPANIDRLKKILPGLAAPGRQNIDVSGVTQLLADTPNDPIPDPGVSVEKPSEDTTEAKPPENPDSSPPT